MSLEQLVTCHPEPLQVAYPDTDDNVFMCLGWNPPFQWALALKNVTSLFDDLLEDMFSYVFSINWVLSYP